MCARQESNLKTQPSWGMGEGEGGPQGREGRRSVECVQGRGQMQRNVCLCDTNEMTMTAVESLCSVNVASFVK